MKKDHVQKTLEQLIQHNIKFGHRHSGSAPPWMCSTRARYRAQGGRLRLGSSLS